MAETVSGLGCDITIIGRRRGKCCDTENVPFNTKRFRMLFKRGFLFYKFFNIRLFGYLLLHKYDLLVSNDLDTLLPNFLVSKIKNLPLVYDSHEYFTGVPEIQNRPFVKWVWKSLEKRIFPHLSYVITVSDSIAVQYELEYGFRPLTVRNCSRKAGHITPFTREELGVKKEELLLILQGTGINTDRGGEELVEAVSQTEMVSLLIVGSGDNIDFLKKRVSELNIEEKVKFFNKVQWKELMRYTKSADIGMTLDKNSNQNYRFSLPNKLFDYISAGLPVIASKLPETDRIITEYSCGIVIEEVSVDKISEAVLQLKDNPDLLAVLKKNAVVASEEINWDIESIKVKELYSKVLNRKADNR
jgi:glycosyltransferase involved in cell wall biosynthesis